MERVAYVAAVGFFSISEWSFTICMTHKNVLRMLLNKTFPFFLGTQSRTEKCFNDEVLFAVFVRCTVCWCLYNALFVQCTVCGVCMMQCLYDALFAVFVRCSLYNALFAMFVRCTVCWCLYDALFAGVCTMHYLQCLYDALFAVFAGVCTMQCLYNALFAGVCTMHCSLVFVRCTVCWCLFAVCVATFQHVCVPAD